MSEFDRTGNLRRSIRRPRKPQAPAPPDANTNDVSSIIKRLLISKGEYVASPPPTVPVPKPRIISMTPALRNVVSPSLLGGPPSLPVTDSSLDDDSSQSALMAIQQQINQIEFNSTIQRNQTTESPITEFIHHKARTRYDEMESLLKTGISDMMTNSEDEDNGASTEKFYRGGGVRSSIQGVPAKQIDPKKIKQSRPVVRTASDSTHADMIRKQIKQREIEKIKIENEKAANQVKWD